MESIEELKRKGVWSEESYNRGKYDERRIINHILDEIEQKYKEYIESKDEE